MAIFAANAPKLPPAVTPPTDAETAEEAEAARLAEVEKANKRRGRGADTLTGGGGVTQTATTARQQVLGA